MNGVINVYKEAGFTSHDVVAKLRGILKQRKIGHTGTLDPDATGVLPVCLGNATKLCGMLTEETKEYEAVLLLGVETDTQDMSGQVLGRREVTITQEQARDAVAFFVGSYAQVPPMYSALKINGKKLYELAREGRTVERQAREVQIHGIIIDELLLPRIKMRVTCSKGTYIRTLCHDIGQMLGTGGAMETLVRTRVGRFRLEEAKTLSQIEAAVAAGNVETLVCPVDSMFADKRGFSVSAAGSVALANGNTILPALLQEKEPLLSEEQVRLYDGTGKFYGIYVYEREYDRLKPVKMFLE